MKSSLAIPSMLAGIFKTALHLRYYPNLINTVRDLETKLGLLIYDPGHVTNRTLYKCYSLIGY